MSGGEGIEQKEFASIERRGRIAVVRFDRGDGLNALSAAAMRELTDIARQLGSETESSVVVLTGTEKAFSAGADLKDSEMSARADMTLLERRQALKVGPDMCRAFEELEQVTIAAVEGFCIGGGVALAVACDLRIAGRSAHFRLPEIPLGMNMSWQSNPRIAGLMGPARAKLFTILGEKLAAPDALAQGLIEEMTADGEAFAAALALAERFAALPPIPVRMTKQAIDMAAKPLNLATSYMDRDQFALTSSTADQREAVSAFLQKRTPDFKGD